MIESPTIRRAILGVLILVIVVCVGVIAYLVGTRSAGDDLGERLSSLQDDDVPGTTVAENREQLLSVSREFATRFNTYDPSMLDDQGHLPEYASVSELMTPKFAGVFEEAIELPEKTVAEFGTRSEGIVYAVGVASQDDDSAEVLVAGTVELSYPYPSDEGGDGGDSGDSGDSGDGNGDSQGEDERLSSGPQRFRYQVSMVKIDGTWLVDDVDDVDDGRPPFSQPAIPEESAEESPSTTPSETPTTDPSNTSTTEPTEGEG